MYVWGCVEIFPSIVHIKPFKLRYLSSFSSNFCKDKKKDAIDASEGLFNESDEETDPLSQTTTNRAAVNSE